MGDYKVGDYLFLYQFANKCGFSCYNSSSNHGCVPLFIASIANSILSSLFTKC